jgi:Heat induced stress protein YflT
MSRSIIGIFNNSNDAENAVKELKSIGYSSDDISIIARETEEIKTLRENTSTAGSVADGAVTGTVTGAGVGALAGLLIGAGILALPGIGGILIGGPIAAALGLTGAAATTMSGAVTGGVAGGIIGALVGMGVSETDAESYSKRIAQGQILLAVRVRDTSDDLPHNIFIANNAEDIKVVQNQ